MAPVGYDPQPALAITNAVIRLSRIVDGRAVEGRDDCPRRPRLRGCADETQKQHGAWQQRPVAPPFIHEAAHHRHPFADCVRPVK